MLDDLFMRIRTEFHEKVKAVETWVKERLNEEGKLSHADKQEATQRLADAVKDVAATANDTATTSQGENTNDNQPE